MKCNIKAVTLVLILIVSTAAVLYAQAPPAAQPQPAPGMQNPSGQPPAGQAPGMGSPGMSARPMPGMMGMGGMPGMMGAAPVMQISGEYVFILRGDQLLQYRVANPNSTDKDKQVLFLIAQTTLPQPPPRMLPPPPGVPNAPQSVVPKPSGTDGQSAVAKQETPKS